MWKGFDKEVVCYSNVAFGNSMKEWRISSILYIAIQFIKWTVDKTLIFFIFLLYTGPWNVFILINCMLVVLATDWFMSSKECGNYIWYSINPFAIFRVITNFRCNYLFNSHDPLSSPSSLPFIFFLKQKLPTTLNSYLIWASLLHENKCFMQRMISNYLHYHPKKYTVWHRFSLETEYIDPCRWVDSLIIIS